MASIQVQPWAAASGGGVWQVVIDHPSKRNALTRQMWIQLREAFVQLHQRTDVRCIVVQGADGVFCAGGDISQYPAFRFEESSLQAFHEQEVWGALQAMLDCDVPVVAHIEGPCMGGGLEIASCCDVRWASEDALFGAPIAKLGFPMAPQELKLISQTVGVHAARRMLLEAAIFTANDMAKLGFIGQPLPGPALVQQVLHSAQRIASLAPQAARLTKQSLRALAAGGVVAQPYAYANSAEHQEGIRAFLDKRAPRFDV